MKTQSQNSSGKSTGGEAMNEIEKGQLCDITMSAIYHGCSKLDSIPALLRRIIENRAWECRQVKMRGVVKLANLRELITKEPMDGWGENPDRIEGLIRDDAEVLAMWREAMKGKPGRPKSTEKTRRNPTTLKTGDRGRAYDLSRLQRHRPDLFAQVSAGTISANAAAIQAGFRKSKAPMEKAVAALNALSLDERNEVVGRVSVSSGNPHELSDGKIGDCGNWDQLIEIACGAIIAASRISHDRGLVRTLGAVARRVKEAA